MRLHKTTRGFPPLKGRFYALLSYVLVESTSRRFGYMKPIVIIGADAAGMSAASVIKREIKDQQVIVFGKEPHISYSA